MSKAELHFALFLMRLRPIILCCEAQSVIMLQASVGHCCETVIFGPGGEPVYQPNESLAISDIEAATRINTLTVLNLMGR